MINLVEVEQRNQMKDCTMTTWQKNKKAKWATGKPKKTTQVTHNEISYFESFVDDFFGNYIYKDTCFYVKFSIGEIVDDIPVIEDIYLKFSYFGNQTEVETIVDITGIDAFEDTYSIIAKAIIEEVQNHIAARKPIEEMNYFTH